VGCEFDLPMPRLVAPVQLRNAAVAIAALRALPTPPPDEAFASGIVGAVLPGRLQRFERDDVEVMVDVGHNPQAAREIAAWLRSHPIESQHPTGGRTLAVYAALADKDVGGVVAALSGSVDGWHLAGLDEVGPRGLGVDDLAARLAGTAAGEGRRHQDVGTAIVAAVEAARPAGRVLVFGSFHTAAAALEALS
jgi:dihydrofolate synthase/folylpolyglutamate synthase